MDTKENLLKAYKGGEKYLFVSYAHKDREMVLPAIKRLAADGYRIWYDEGIEVGDDWAEKIGTSLENAALILFFASKDSVKSQNCLRELTFAKEHDIPVLTVQCGTFDMPEELSRQLMTNQAAQITNYDTYGSLVKGLKPVLDRHEVGGGITVEIQDEKINFRQSGGGRKTGKIVVAILIVLCIIGFAAFRIFFGNVPSVVGSQTSDAQNAIKDAGFEPTVSYNYSDEYEYGIVFEQSSEGRTLKAVPVVIKQSIGPEEDLTDVPDTVGSHISDGARMLIDAGLKSFKIATKADGKSKPAFIIAQSIPAGLRVSRNNVMSLDVATDGGDIVFEINGKEFTVRSGEELLVDASAIKEEPAEDVDEYGMTAEERAYWDSLVVPFYGGENRKGYPFVDADTLKHHETYPKGGVMYIARSMTVVDEPNWADQYIEFVIPPGVTLTLDGSKWSTDMAFTVMPGATLIIDGNINYQYGVNHGRLIVNGSLETPYHKLDQWGYQWGELGNDGTITVNGSCGASQFWAYKGGSVSGTVSYDKYVDRTGESAPAYCNGPDGFGNMAADLNANWGT